MKQIIITIYCLVVPFVAMGQQATERPSWVNGYHVDRSNSYVDVFSAVDYSTDAARVKAIQRIVDERSRATGRRYNIKESNGDITFSSQDELIVKCRVVDEYHERLSSGEYQVSLLVQTAKNPMFSYEPVTVTTSYPISARILVPGMAQLHKGSTTKGIAFIAAEIAAVGGIVAFEGLRSSYESKINTTHNAKERQNYIDKADNMQNLRNGFIAGAAAIYLWNVVDGMVAKGKKHIEVGRLSVNINPYSTQNEAGVLLSINF